MFLQQIKESYIWNFKLFQIWCNSKLIQLDNLHNTTFVIYGLCALTLHKLDDESFTIWMKE